MVSLSRMGAAKELICAECPSNAVSWAIEALVIRWPLTVMRAWTTPKRVVTADPRIVRLELLGLGLGRRLADGRAGAVVVRDRAAGDPAMLALDRRAGAVSVNDGPGCPVSTADGIESASPAGEDPSWLLKLSRATSPVTVAITANSTRFTATRVCGQPQNPV
jgi:hypothetical protein